MLAIIKSKIRFEIIAAYIAVWVFGTYVFDRIVMMMARPYLLDYYNGILNKPLKPDFHKIYYLFK